MRTRPVTAPQVRAYADKAQEYAEAAASELESERYIAATSLAIHAAINAADTVCGARLGQRAAGEDHDHVRALLKQAGSDGANVEICAGSCRSTRRRSTNPTVSPGAPPPRRWSAPNDA